MKVTVEPQSSPDYWRHPVKTGVNIRVFANSEFQTFNGQIIPGGNPHGGNPYFYLKVPCTITGGTTLVTEGFEIDATEDSPTNPSVVYSAYLYVGNRLVTPYLLGFPVPATRDPNTELYLNQTWTSLQIHRDRHLQQFWPTGQYDIGQVQYLIAQALGLLRKGSPSQIGMLALQDPAVDPNFPTALGTNSPGVVRDSGVATIEITTEGSRVIVPSPAVSPTCVIHLTSQDEGVSGELRAPKQERVNGVSFVVVSSNGADEGDVGWSIFEP